MKILHLSFSLLNGGKENMLVDIANQQMEFGHEVGILIVNNKIESSIENRISKKVRLFKLNRNPAHPSIRPFLKLFLIVNLRFRANVLHCHDASLGKILRNIAPTKRVLTIHGPGIETASMHYFNKLFAISESVKSDVEKRDNLNCHVIYNGISTNQIQQKETYQLQDTFNIVQVKRLNHERKGQDILINAIERLISKNKINNISVHIIGEGESRKYLEQLILSLKLQKNIFLVGNKERDWIYSHLKDYDLFVHPSRFEGFGLTVAEAMAAKLPVIASNIEGPAEILENGKFGFLFQNENINELTEKISVVLSLYKTGKIEKIAIQAWKHCMNKFDIKTTAQNYCDNYL
jgi:glycosyltransferase involved in cell wall biosynthesis